MLALAAISLFAVSVINQQQVKRRVISQKLGQLKRRASEIEELAAKLESLVETPNIPKAINDEVVDIIATMQRLAPQNPYFDITMETALARSEELSDGMNKAPTYRMMESDAAIARAQYSLTEAAQIIRKRQAAGAMEVAEMESYIRDLAWANFMVKVVSHVGQGHKAASRGDIIRAHAFYRKALEVATEGNYQDERQNQLITELDEILNNKRKALSPSIMPETGAETSTH